MEKLPPSIVFDYLKGIVYKMQNEFEEMKTKGAKVVGHHEEQEDDNYLL